MLEIVVLGTGTEQGGPSSLADKALRTRSDGIRLGWTCCCWCTRLCQKTSDRQMSQPHTPWPSRLVVAASGRAWSRCCCVLLARGCSGHHCAVMVYTQQKTLRRINNSMSAARTYPEPQKLGHSVRLQHRTMYLPCKCGLVSFRVQLRPCVLPCVQQHLLHNNATSAC